MATLDELRTVRREKLARLRKAGVDPYPARSNRTHAIAQVRDAFSQLEASGERITIAGRIRSVREHGEICFADVEDGTGKLQLLLNPDTLQQPTVKDFVELFDIGDFAEASGVAVKTKTGELTLAAAEIRMLSKALRPLPEKWHGLQDHEERFRKRYLDLVMNPDVRERFRVRSRIIQELRGALLSEGFEEVETPILQRIPGGASAQPFTTRLEALKLDLYLRVAPELYLKRLLVGGYEKVFEIGRNFRNEGMDRDHNPEFTMLELYWAYQDYRGLIAFLQRLLKPFVPRWQEVTFEELFRAHAKTEKDWRKIPPPELDGVYKREIRIAGKIKKTTLVVDYPESIMQLAKLKEGELEKAERGEPALTESFQLIAGSEDDEETGLTGMHGGPEIAKGFSELNDPEFQRTQMERQEKEFRAGNEETGRLDEDFIEALEYGMPPAAGLGIGIDRLVRLVTKAPSLREAVLFPFMKPDHDA